MAGQHRQTRSNSTHSVSSSNVVGVHYKVGRKIGEGSFGIIYEGIFFLAFRVYIYIYIYIYIYNVTYTIRSGINLMNNQQVAIKFESRKSDAPQLRDEYRTYKILAGISR